ncbi:MAG: hypothetical protein ACE5IP_13005 [Terriglobia bacterium]
MKRALPAFLALLLLAASTALASPLAGQAQPAQRWLHVRVEDTGNDAQTVRVSVPLTLAEKILPAIHKDKLRGGKLRMGRVHIEGVDVRAILEAVRDLDDAEFVTVESDRETVRVAKEGGYLIVKVREQRDDRENRVDVRVPFPVVEALLSGEDDELDLLAAIRVLKELGDGVLVTVNDDHSRVRVWIDDQSTQAE